MKVCLYLEFEKRLKCSGIGTAISNQRKALSLNGVEWTGSLNHNDFDIIHINIIGPKSLYIAKKMKRRGKKVILHAHVTADDFRNSYMFSNLIAPFLKAYLTYYYNQADLVLCPSEYTKGVLEGYGVKKEIRVISNGIDTEKFQFSGEGRNKFRREFDINGISVLSVGHVFIRKGISTFVEVGRTLPNNKFLWIGRRYKKLEEPMVSQIVNNAPKNVNFLEYIEEIVSAYSGSDIFFFPSFCENQGIVLLEAAACQRPILVRDLPTYNGWLIDGINCLKAKTDDEFHEKLKTLIEDEQLRKRLAENAYNLSKEHSLKEVGAKLKGIYEYVLGEK